MPPGRHSARGHGSSFGRASRIPHDELEPLMHVTMNIVSYIDVVAQSLADFESAGWSLIRLFAVLALLLLIGMVCTGCVLYGAGKLIERAGQTRELWESVSKPKGDQAS
jgi:hypothetical protein